MFFSVCQGEAVLTFALCAFGWEVHTPVECEGLCAAWEYLCAGCCLASRSGEGILSWLVSSFCIVS